MSIFKKSLGWIRVNIKWLLGTMAVLATVVCMYWFRNNIKETELAIRKIDIAKKRRDISVLEERKAALDLKDDGVLAEIESIEARIDSTEKELVKRRVEIVKLQLNQKLDNLDDMGY